MNYASHLFTFYFRYNSKNSFLIWILSWFYSTNIPCILWKKNIFMEQFVFSLIYWEYGPNFLELKSVPVNDTSKTLRINFKLFREKSYLALAAQLLILQFVAELRHFCVVGLTGGRVGHQVQLKSFAGRVGCLGAPFGRQFDALARLGRPLLGLRTWAKDVCEHFCATRALRLRPFSAQRQWEWKHLLLPTPQGCLPTRQCCHFICTFEWVGT